MKFSELELFPDSRNRKEGENWLFEQSSIVHREREKVVDFSVNNLEWKKLMIFPQTLTFTSLSPSHIWRRLSFLSLSLRLTLFSQRIFPFFDWICTELYYFTRPKIEETLKSQKFGFCLYFLPLFLSSNPPFHSPPLPNRKFLSLSPFPLLEFHLHLVIVSWFDHATRRTKNWRDVSIENLK